MSGSFRLGQRCLAFIIFIGLLAGFLPTNSSVLAQEPIEPTTTVNQPEQVQQPVQPVPSSALHEESAPSREAEIYDPKADSQPETEHPALESNVDEASGSSVAPDALPLIPTIANAPNMPTTMALTVSVQPTVRPTEYITYVVSYRNTGTTATTSLLLDAVWLNFEYGEGGAWQYCPPVSTSITGCGFVTAATEGPAVTVVGNITNGVRYSIATLQPGQNGKFVIRLIINRNTFPTTVNPDGQGPRRPSMSGKLFVDGSATAIERTATSLIQGPVLTLTKLASPNVTLYPLETGVFTITVGNATGSGDSSGGSIRTDATRATNIVMKDTVPLGAEFVSALSATGVYSLTGSILTWIIPSLEVGQKVTLVVRFKKLDVNSPIVNSECGKLNNDTYYVTSNEIPFNPSNNLRYLIYGNGARYDVATPLLIRDIFVVPGSVVYGQEATFTVIAESYWEQPLTNVQLEANLPSNVTYVVNSATPTPTTVPPVGQTSGTLVWTFNMPAASRTVPAQKTFTFRVATGFTNPANGFMRLIAPPGANVPMACAAKPVYGLSMRPRLKIIMASDAPVNTQYNQELYRVIRNQSFPYSVIITNQSTVTAVLDKVWVNLPAERLADFQYIVGSSTINGTARAPDTIANGLAGKLEWLNVTVPANGETVIKFALRVQGTDYVQYCAYAYGTRGQEDITFGYPGRMCVKINPNVRLTKTANISSGLPGAEVIFTLTLVNEENQAYTLGLYDALYAFEWVGQISGYAQPFYDSSRKTLEWPLVSVAPGGSLTAIIKARIPGGGASSCNPGSYINEIMFTNVDSIIRQLPPVYAEVAVICRQLEYSHSYERDRVSLQDKFWYNITLRNIDPAGPTNTVMVTDILPLGFTYVQIEPTSEFMETPTQTVGSDGRIRLNWTLPPLAPSTTKTLKFIARSGNSIATHDNWAQASTTSSFVSCVGGPCESQTYNGISSIYAVRTVRVEAMITVEPLVTPNTCVTPGTLLTYKITILNTNSHDYPDTDVSITLPLGLIYDGPISALQPSLGINADGTSTLAWENVNVRAAPAGGFTQRVLQVRLKVGNVWGNLSTVVQTTSDYGAIPRRDGVVDPTVPVCAPTASMAKIADRRIVRVGQDVIYQISIANPGDTAITATVLDVLPSGMTFTSMLAGGAPTISSNQLTWNVSVPARAQNTDGSVVLRFKVRVNSGTALEQKINTATITQSSAPITNLYDGTAINIATIIIGKAVFLPSITR